MAYFSNGSEGEYYAEKFCGRCIHQADPCAVYLLHLQWNYEQHNTSPEGQVKKMALDILWPREGVHNGECKMFKQAAESGVVIPADEGASAAP